MIENNEYELLKNNNNYKSNKFITLKSHKETLKKYGDTEKAEKFIINRLKNIEIKADKK